jgi:hypothetical protein
MWHPCVLQIILTLHAINILLQAEYCTVYLFINQSASDTKIPTKFRLRGPTLRNLAISPYWPDCHLIRPNCSELTCSIFVWAFAIPAVTIMTCDIHASYKLYEYHTLYCCMQAYLVLFVCPLTDRPTKWHEIPTECRLRAWPDFT